MKKLLLVSLLFLFICCDKNGKGTVDTTVTDTIYLTNGEKDHSMKLVTVNDTSQFSKRFIEDLKKEDYPYNITLIDSCLVTNGDSIQIPMDLELKKEYLFEKHTDSGWYEVYIKRINLTRITYKIKEKFGYDEDEFVIGEADLSGRFFDDKHSHSDSTVFKYEVFEANRYNSLQDEDIFIDIGKSEKEDSIRVVMNVPEKNITTASIFKQQIHIETVYTTKRILLLVLSFILYVLSLIFVFGPIYASIWRYFEYRAPVRANVNKYLKLYRRRKQREDLNDEQYEEYLEWATKRGYKPIIKKREY